MKKRFLITIGALVVLFVFVNSANAQNVRTGPDGPNQQVKTCRDLPLSRPVVYKRNHDKKDRNFHELKRQLILRNRHRRGPNNHRPRSFYKVLNLEGPQWHWHRCR